MSNFQIEYNAGHGWKPFYYKEDEISAIKLAEQLTNRNDIWICRVVNRAGQQVWPTPEEGDDAPGNEGDATGEVFGG